MAHRAIRPVRGRLRVTAVDPKPGEPAESSTRCRHLIRAPNAATSSSVRARTSAPDLELEVWAALSGKRCPTHKRVSAGKKAWRLASVGTRARVLRRAAPEKATWTPRPLRQEEGPRESAQEEDRRKRPRFEGKPAGEAQALKPPGRKPRHERSVRNEALTRPKERRPGALRLIAFPVSRRPPRRSCCTSRVYVSHCVLVPLV